MFDDEDDDEDDSISLGDRLLPPAEATAYVNKLARGTIDITWTKKAAGKLKERKLISGDFLYILKFGRILADDEPSTQQNVFKYIIECKSPNSSGENIRLKILVGKDPHIKVQNIID